jgi:hypothetical protein
MSLQIPVPAYGITPERMAAWDDDTGGALPAHIIEIPAGAWDYPTSGGVAELDTDTGTNGQIKRQQFAVNDALERTSLIVPAGIDAAGDVTFEVTGYAVTAASNKLVQWRLSHSAVAGGASWDAAYTDEDSGDQAIEDTQDVLDVLTWTVSVADLGWSAGDNLRIKLARIAASVDELAGAYGLINFRILIPRA